MAQNYVAVLLVLAMSCGLRAAPSRKSIGIGGLWARHTFLHRVASNQLSKTISYQAPTLGFRYMNTRNLGVLVEVHYAQKPLEVETTDAPKIAYRRVNHLLDLPILSNFELVHKQIKLVLQVGPQVSFLLREQQNPVVADASLRSLEEYSMHALDANRVRFGMCAGTGLAYGFLKNYYLAIVVRYTYGMSNHFHSDNFAFFRSTTGGIQLQVHRLF